MISVSEQECTHESGVLVLISETVPCKSTDRRGKNQQYFQILVYNQNTRNNTITSFILILSPLKPLSHT